MNNPTVAQQIEEHLVSIEMSIRALRAQMLPVPPRQLVWDLGATCRLAGSRFLGITKTLEEMELERKNAPPLPDHTESATAEQGRLFA